MLLVVTRALRLAVVRAQMQKPIAEKPQGPVVGFAKSPACFGHLVEYRFEPGRAGDGAKDSDDRALLLPQVLELTREVRAVPGDAGLWGA